MSHRALRTMLSLATGMVLSIPPVASSQDASYLGAPPVSAAPADTTILDDGQLQSLLAPIALYPDPLIAQILPASTYPLQIVDAERWQQANPNAPEAAIDAQPFEPPVVALLHYPTVLAMLNSQLDWTQSLGVAFINQQADVMTAIQELRQQAQAAGALQSSPQQQVVTDDDVIDILPADPNVVYVPQYDPQVVYVGGGNGVYLTYGTGYPEGLWLNNNVDWHNRWIADGNGWHHGWDRPGPTRRGEERPITKPWARDRAQPLPVRNRAPAPARGRDVRPGYEAPRPAAAPRAFDGYQNRAAVQHDDQRAQESRRAPEPAKAEPARRAAEPARAEPARPAPEPARAAPARPAPEPARAEPARRAPEPARASPARPAPEPARAAPARPAPAARQAPAQVFHAQEDGRTTAAQSARGNQSKAAAGGRHK